MHANTPSLFDLLAVIDTWHCHTYATPAPLVTHGMGIRTVLRRNIACQRYLLAMLTPIEEKSHRCFPSSAGQSNPRWRDTCVLPCS